jgi:hypothetical protein
MNIEWHRPKNSIIEILNRNRKFIDSEIQSQCKLFTKFNQYSSGQVDFKFFK